MFLYTHENTSEVVDDDDDNVEEERKILFDLKPSWTKKATDDDADEKWVSESKITWKD